VDITEAVDEVVTITKRADKRAEILSNVNKAMAFFTFKADFSRDLVEETIAIDPEDLGQTLDLTDFGSIVRFRKMKFVRPTLQRYYLLPIDPSDVLTPGGSVQKNRYFIAGTSLTFTLSTADTSLEIGYYQYAPTLVEGSTPAETHWMLDLMPWAITERAAAQTFRSIGDDASAAFYERSSMEFFLAARRDFADQIAANASL
jgi:hypothetical protein